GPFTTVGREEGLPDDVVESLYQDSAGALWIGTRWRGATRMKDAATARFSTAEGLPNDRVNAIAESPPGVLWLGTAAGLARVGAEGPVVYAAGGGTAADNVSALAADDDGTLWVGTWDGLFHFAGGAFTRTGDG